MSLTELCELIEILRISFNRADGSKLDLVLLLTNMFLQLTSANLAKNIASRPTEKLQF